MQLRVAHARQLSVAHACRLALEGNNQGHPSLFHPSIICLRNPRNPYILERSRLNIIRPLRAYQHKLL
uniref:Uncharacterized protein n=1 Tax=Arundo donax TaxID=35708 RepID=A0A0A8Z9L1_ARUDO